MLKKSTVRLSCLVIAVGLSLAGGPTAMAAEVVTGPTVTAPVVQATANVPCTQARHFGSGQWMRLVPTTSAGVRDCYLVRGNTGNGVRALQYALRDCERISIGLSGADGSFGPATQTALRRFQSYYSYRLTVDGSYGNQVHNFIEFRSSTDTYYFCNRSTRL